MQIQLKIPNQCLLQKRETIIVGVSGGPDSVCLLHLLVSEGFSIIAAHFDHCLRPESAQDAKIVRDFSEELGVPFVLGKMDVNAFSREKKLSIEEGGREARYQFLFQEARRTSSQAIAVAHTADDQVETVLMHFLRGTGLSGLKGMEYRTVIPSWDNEIPLVRPLLETSREEILSYCQRNNLQPVYDLTNDNTKIYRNRIRHELIPYLAQYNPQIKQVISRMIKSLAADHEDIIKETRIAFEQVLLKYTNEEIFLSKQSFVKLSTGLQRNIVRRSVEIILPGLRDIDFDLVERAIHFIKNPTRSKNIYLGYHIHLIQDGDQITFSSLGTSIIDKNIPQIIGETQHYLDIPGDIEINHGWRMAGNWEKFSDLEQIKTADSYQVWLDAEYISLPLIIHSHAPGDRFQPLGMAGKSMKVSDFFINEHLPRHARAQWPLVWSQGKIVWIPGYRPAEFCRINKNCKRAIHLRLFRCSG